MDKLILHLIGQYADVSQGGGVGASMLAHWLNISRQGANYHLRKLLKDKLLMRYEESKRGGIECYRYVLSEKSRELYEDGKFVSEYYEFVMKDERIEFFHRTSMRIFNGRKSQKEVTNG